MTPLAQAVTGQLLLSAASASEARSCLMANALSNALKAFTATPTLTNARHATTPARPALAATSTRAQGARKATFCHRLLASQVVSTVCSWTQASVTNAQLDAEPVAVSLSAVHASHPTSSPATNALKHARAAFMELQIDNAQNARTNALPAPICKLARLAQHRSCWIWQTVSRAALLESGLTMACAKCAPVDVQLVRMELSACPV